MSLDQIDLTTAQRPTAAQWEAYFNGIIAAVNTLLALGLSLNPAGRLVGSITGDAVTVGGLTPEEIVGGEFPELLKTLADLLVGENGLILSGGVATKNAGTANRLDVTACTALQKIAETGYLSRVELGATHKTTSVPNTAYYLDVEPDAEDFSWGTAHPATDYVPIAVVLTNPSANIATVTDARPLTSALLAGMSGQLTTGVTDGSITAAKLASDAVETAKVLNGAITLAKIANIAASRILGRVTAESGVVEELTAAQVRTLLSVAENAAALGETDTTAYRGDRGKTAYDHSQVTHNAALVGLSNVTNNAQARLGTANTDIDLIKTLFLFTDTRSLVATAWDADDRPTTLEIRNGVAVLCTVTVTYNADGKITELIVVNGGTTVTYTLTWDGDKFVSQTKAVV